MSKGLNIPLNRIIDNYEITLVKVTDVEVNTGYIVVNKSSQYCEDWGFLK